MSSSVSSNAAFTTPYPKSAVKEAFAMSMQSPYGHRANSAKPPPKFSAAAVASPGAATSLSAASLSETERKMKALVSTCEQLKEERASLRAEMSKVTQETMDFQVFGSPCTIFALQENMQTGKALKRSGSSDRASEAR